MEGWKIRKDKARPQKPCCRLAAGSDYFAVLELPDCTRRDLCEACFRELERNSEEPLLFWRGHHRPGGKSSTGPVLDLASLRVLFDRLGEATDPDGSEAGEESEAADDANESKAETAAGLRYLVALLLLRKRKLKMVPATTPEQEAADLVVVDPKIEGMEPVALRAPELDSDRLASLKEDLLAAL